LLQLLKPSACRCCITRCLRREQHGPKPLAEMVVDGCPRFHHRGQMPSQTAQTLGVGLSRAVAGESPASSESDQGRGTVAFVCARFARYRRLGSMTLLNTGPGSRYLGDT
jgi:hypothetical protein